MLTVKQERAYIDKMIAEDKQLNERKNAYYRQALIEIRNHLNYFYLAYQENEVLSIGNLLSITSRDDQAEYQQQARIVQPTDEESDKHKRELNAIAGFDKMHLLMASIGLSVLGATIKTQKLLNDSLHDEFSNEVKRQYSNLPVHKQSPTIKASDLLFSHAKLSKYGDIDRILAKADEIIPTTVKGEQWSNTIWMYNDNLVGNVQNIVRKSLLGGLTNSDLNKLFSNIKPTPHTITGAVQQTDSVIERIVRTERARVMDDAQMAVFKDEGVEWFDWVTEAGACGKCIDLESGSPYRTDSPDAPTIPESSHANCRCSKVATSDPDSLFSKLIKPAVVYSGAIISDWSDEKPISKTEEKAKRMYSEFINRKADPQINAVAVNTGFSRKAIRMVYNHIFTDKHLFEGSGKKHQFFPSYNMALSWQHLIGNNKNDIAKSDLLMLEHELYESILMKSENWTYEKAHNETEKIYNYREELKKEGIDVD